MELKTKMDTNGYKYIYAPGHPWANKSGKIYEHVYVVCMSIGRKLDKDECVHHKDRDRTNNSLDNLQLMTHSEHLRLHHKEDRGFEQKIESRTCEFCKTVFDINVKQQLGRFCSKECSDKGSRLFEVTAEDLKKLVWEMPTIKVAEMFNVSDSAVGKRCRLLGVEKPPRGYWRKVECGKLTS